MAKKKRHGRGREKQPHRRHHAPRTPQPTHDDDAADQLLFQSLRQALRADGPLELLQVVSGILQVADPRGRDPFAKDEQRVDLAQLVESFIETPYAETTAALTVIRAWVSDEIMAARIGRELVQRRHPMPGWLSGLDHPVADADVWLLTHIQGDGDDYLMGVTLPSGQQLAALVYVDHNLGTIVKDAFVASEPLEDLALQLGSLIDEPDQSLNRTDPATARAVVETAIDAGSRFYPPFTSDTWPLCRPLVEWMLRLLPPGGVAPERKVWTDDEQSAIADEFFASEFGAPHDSADERALMESLLWFGTGYATGDPYRWSPVTVELLLADWFPRKVVAEPAYLAKLPDLVRAYIRYCDGRRGLRRELTDETLAAVDAWEPEYQRLIRSARPQGPEALIAGMFEGGVVGVQSFDDVGDYGGANIPGIMLDRLDRLVGGRVQLQNLDTDPLPDERFEWAGIPEDIRPVVQQVLDACDNCADELLDVEHRTAMRRFLSRAAVGDPAVFRRRASPVRAAAAVAWVICRANDTAGQYRDLTVQELLAWFGVKGSVSQRAEPLLRANGVNPHENYGTMDLRAADLLVSVRRQEIIDTRDYWITE